MGGAGGNLDLFQEPLDAEKGGETGQQNSERHAAPMLAVVREVHGRHTTATEHLTELVALGERRLEVGGDIRGHAARIYGWRSGPESPGKRGEALNLRRARGIEAERNHEGGAMLRVLLLVSLISAYPGGWAAITVEELPDYVVADRPVTLTFTVRQHGVTRLSGLRPRVEARAGGVTAQAMATPGREAGQYVASLTLPRPGPAIAPRAQAPSSPPDSERGRRLFVAKGCVPCHVHGDIQGSGTVAVGPNLTERRRPADYLRLFLANPAIAPQSGTFRMPDLGLKSQELAALAAFLSAERQALQ